MARETVRINYMWEKAEPYTRSTWLARYIHTGIHLHPVFVTAIGSLEFPGGTKNTQEFQKSAWLPWHLYFCRGQN